MAGVYTAMAAVTELAPAKVADTRTQEGVVIPSRVLLGDLG